VIAGAGRGSRHLWFGEAGADEERLEFRIAAHEAAVEFVGGGGVALAEDVLAEGAAGLRVEDALALEAGEGVGIEHLGPFVGVIAGGVAGGAAEEVVETAHHGGRAGFHRGAVIGEDFLVDLVEVAAIPGGEAGVQFEVELAEGELAHERRGAEVVARGDHFVEKILRDRLAGFVVAGEQVERLAIPAEIFHDLRGQFDEIPGDVGAGKRFDGHIAEQAVEEVAELVENRFDFRVGQQGGLASVKLSVPLNENGCPIPTVPSPPAAPAASSPTTRHPTPPPGKAGKSAAATRCRSDATSPALCRDRMIESPARGFPPHESAMPFNSFAPASTAY